MPPPYIPSQGPRGRGGPPPSGIRGGRGGSMISRGGMGRGGSDRGRGGSSVRGRGGSDRGRGGSQRGRGDSAAAARGRGGSSRGSFSIGNGAGGAGGRLMIRANGKFDIEARRKEILANKAKGRGREREGTTKATEVPELVMDVDLVKVEDIATKEPVPEVTPQIKLEKFHQKKRRIYLKGIENRIDRLDDIENYPEWVTTVYKELQLNGCSSLIPGSDEEVNETHDIYIRSVLLNSVTIDNFFFDPKFNSREMLLYLKEESAKVNSLEFLLKKLSSIELKAVTRFKYDEKDAEKFVKDFRAYSSRIFTTCSNTAQDIPNLAKIFLESACKVSPYKNFEEKGKITVEGFGTTMDEFKLATITDNFIEFVKQNTASNPTAGFNQMESFKKATVTSSAEQNGKRRREDDDQDKEQPHRGHGPPSAKQTTNAPSAYSIRSKDHSTPQHPARSGASSYHPPASNGPARNTAASSPATRGPPSGPSSRPTGPPSGPGARSTGPPKGPGANQRSNGPPTGPQSSRGPPTGPQSLANRGPPTGPGQRPTGPQQFSNNQKGPGPNGRNAPAPRGPPQGPPQGPGPYSNFNRNGPPAGPSGPSQFQRNAPPSGPPTGPSQFQRNGPPTGPTPQGSSQGPNSFQKRPSSQGAPPPLGPNTQFQRNGPPPGNRFGPGFGPGSASGPPSGPPPTHQQQQGSPPQRRFPPSQQQQQGPGQFQPQQRQPDIPPHPLQRQFHQNQNDPPLPQQQQPYNGYQQGSPASSDQFSTPRSHSSFNLYNTNTPSTPQTQSSFNQNYYQPQQQPQHSGFTASAPSGFKPQRSGFNPNGPPQYQQQQPPQQSQFQRQGPHQQPQQFQRQPPPSTQSGFNPFQQAGPPAGFQPQFHQAGPPQPQQRNNGRCPSCHEFGHGADQCWKNGY
ncbi:hypothetical protein WICPIJ_009615 [Wickerhamomyces pijperi]|uniref:Uncharacterized protein n=1 Tax=Wickerhamomyces pijperi TaxID=599730 RepID=A0A9P8PLV8_WICPI|nr:hypothetical protein WICPIJ_009615 [Wickerhamomyces pijperi]